MSLVLQAYHGHPYSKPSAANPRRQNISFPYQKLDANVEAPTVELLPIGNVANQINEPNLYCT